MIAVLLSLDKLIFPDAGVCAGTRMTSQVTDHDEEFSDEAFSAGNVVFRFVSGLVTRSVAAIMGRGTSAPTRASTDAVSASETGPATIVKLKSTISETATSETTANEATTSETTASEAATSETTANEATTGETIASEAATSETTANEAATGETIASEAATSETTANEATTGETIASEAATGETTASEVTTGETTASEAATGETTASVAATSETTASEATTGETTANEATTGETIASEAATSETTRNEATTGETIASEAATSETTASEATTGETTASVAATSETTANETAESATIASEIPGGTAGTVPQSFVLISCMNTQISTMDNIMNSCNDQVASTPAAGYTDQLVCNRQSGSPLEVTLSNPGNPALVGVGTLGSRASAGDIAGETASVFAEESVSSDSVCIPSGPASAGNMETATVCVKDAVVINNSVYTPVFQPDQVNRQEFVIKRLLFLVTVFMSPAFQLNQVTLKQKQFVLKRLLSLATEFCTHGNTASSGDIDGETATVCAKRAVVTSGVIPAPVVALYSAPAAASTPPEISVPVVDPAVSPAVTAFLDSALLILRKIFQCLMCIWRGAQRLLFILRSFSAFAKPLIMLILWSLLVVACSKFSSPEMAVLWVPFCFMVGFYLVAVPDVDPTANLSIFRKMFQWLMLIWRGIQSYLSYSDPSTGWYMYL